MGHPMGIFSYGRAPVRSHPHDQYHVTSSFPMSCGKDLPQLMTDSVNGTSLICFACDGVTLGLSIQRSSSPQRKRNNPTVWGALQTACELCWELDTRRGWKTDLHRQCHQHAALCQLISFYAGCYKPTQISQSCPRVVQSLCDVFFHYDAHKNRKEEVRSPRR